MASLKMLLAEIRDCRHCEAHLPNGPRPILAASPSSRILIIGQAPGARVHASGVPWDDASGQRLREWMGIQRDDFYDPELVAIVPMGFCFPGTGKSGDLPPRKECAELWHLRLLKQLNQVKLTLLVGRYAQAWALGDRSQSNLTTTVEAWKQYIPRYLPMPHPSPRNNRWLRNNPWFESDVLPWLRRTVGKLTRGRGTP